MRAFVAVDLPLEGVPEARGSATAPFHLTLRFFPDLKDADVPRAVRAVERAAGSVPAFPLKLQGIGAFPGERRPRVVFVRVTDGAAELSALSAALERALAEEGFPPIDRPFVPHATLFRVRDARSLHRARELLAAHPATEFARATIERMALKSSELTRDGAIHRVVCEVRLGPAASP